MAEKSSVGVDAIPNIDTVANFDQIADKIANSVLSNIEFQIALIGLLGVVAGAFIQVLGNVLLHWYQSREKKIDIQRKRILKTMLEIETHEWRKLSTLAAVVGATEEETKRLLIEIHARRSESNKDVWALISRKPLKEIKLD